MAEQTNDPRFESLLRGALAAEVASLPLTIGPERILDHAGARRGGRARSRLGLGISVAGRSVCARLPSD